MILENVLHIEAPPARVWEVTVDVERWPRWAPTFQGVRRLDEGPFRLGSRAAIVQPGLAETTWEVTAMEEGRAFTWEGRARGISMRATHEVDSDGAGTRSVLRVEMEGGMTWLLGPLLRWAVGRSLRRENAALREECTRSVDAPA